MMLVSIRNARPAAVSVRPSGTSVRIRHGSANGIPVGFAASIVVVHISNVLHVDVLSGGNRSACWGLPVGRMPPQHTIVEVLLSLSHKRDVPRARIVKIEGG
jgi:hypothetical protein